MDETFNYESNPTGSSNVSIDGGDGDDTLEALFHGEGAAGGAPVTTQFTQNPDGTFTATYSNYTGFSSDQKDSLTVTNIENIRITLTNYYYFGTTLYPIGAADQIRTGHGNDYVSTALANDLIDVGRGIDEVDGGDGIDGIAKDFSDVATPILWDLTTGAFSGPGSFIGLEWFINLVTGSGNDVIVTRGDNASGAVAVGSETISTGAGNDSVTLHDGQDIVDLGSGIDRLILDYRGESFTNNTTLTRTGSFGEGYSGTFAGIQSDAPTVTFAGVEHFSYFGNESGGNGVNLIDDLTLGDGDDVAFTFISNDLIRVGRGIDQVDGGVGIDGLQKIFERGGPAIAIDLLANTYSGPGSFTNLEYFIDLQATDGNDVIVTTLANGSGTEGNDLIATFGGNDSVTLRNGQDQVDLGTGSDRLILDYRGASFTNNTTLTNTGSLATGYSGTFAGIQSDAPTVTFAGVEHFTFYGNESGGNGVNLIDDLTLGDGDDVVSTFISNDLIRVGGGVDQVDGGVGTDGLQKVFDRAGPAIAIDLLANTFSGPGSFSNLEYFIGLQATDGDDVIVTSHANGDGALGNDTIATYGGNDVVTLLDDDDTVDLGEGNDRLVLDYRDSAFQGNTTLSISGSGTYSGSFNGFGGASSANVTFQGVEHFSVYTSDSGGNGANAADNVSTGAGDDIIFTFHAVDTISSGAGNDVIDAGISSDTVDAGAGNDQVTGGVGNDTLNGGAGFDTAVFAGNRSAYSWTGVNGETRTQGPDGADKLTGFERMQFADVSYEYGPSGSFAAPVLLTASFGAGASAGGWSSQRVYPRTLADVDGNGRPDIVGFGSGGVFVSLTDDHGVTQPAYFALNSFGADASAGGWSDNQVFPRSLADIDGDGRADLVGFGAAGVYAALATSGGSFGAVFLAEGGYGADPSAGGWSDTRTYPRLLADVNGDGMADIVGFGDGGVHVSLAVGGGSFGDAYLASAGFGAGAGAGGWSDDDVYTRTLADINGDGRADIVGFGSGGVHVALAQADGHFADPFFAFAGFGAEPSAGGWTSNNLYYRTVGDLDGDGHADLVGFGDAGVFAAYGDGSGGFTAGGLLLNSFGVSAAAGGWTSQDLYPRLLADLNGDGADDIVGFGDGGVIAASSVSDWVLV